MQAPPFIKLGVFKPYLDLALLFLIAFSIAGIGALGRTSQAGPNPFEAYLDIFPNQPMSAVVAHGFSCRVSHYHYAKPVQTLCVLTPTVGIFSSIEVEDIDQRVSRIKFALRGDTLRLGDLLVMFNLPPHRAFPETIFVFWRDYFATAEVREGGWLNAVNEQVWTITFSRLDGGNFLVSCSLKPILTLYNLCARLRSLNFTI